MRIIDNEKGFSLTEILIAVAIMGGLALVSLQLVDNQTNNERSLKAAAEVNKAVALIQGAISGEDSCKNLLKGIAATTSGTQIASLRTTYRNPLSGVTSFREIINHNKNYSTFYTQPGDIRFVKVSNTPVGTIKANLVLTFRVRRGSSKANFTTETAKDTKIIRTLPVEYKGSSVAGTIDQVVSCGPVMSEANELARQKFCASMDPTELPAQLTDPTLGLTYWDAAAKKCNLRSQDCKWGEVPKEMTNLGNITCVPLESTMTPNSIRQIFDDTSCKSSSGNFNITVGPDGRLKIKCI